MADVVTATFNFSVSVTGYPNVSIDAVTVNGQTVSPGQTIGPFFEGDTLSIAVSITNVGNLTGYCWAFAFREDTGDVIGPKQGTTLDPGMGTVVSWTWTIPSGTAGTTISITIQAGYTE